MNKSTKGSRELRSQKDVERALLLVDDFIKSIHAVEMYEKLPGSEDQLGSAYVIYVVLSWCLGGDGLEKKLDDMAQINLVLSLILDFHKAVSSSRVN